MELAQNQQTSSTSSKYIRDFESLFVPIKIEQLRDKARDGNLRHCQFRSLCWRYFLHCLPEQYNQWLASCEESRAKYELIRKRHYLAMKQLTCDQTEATSANNELTSPGVSDTIIDNIETISRTVNISSSLEDSKNLQTITNFNHKGLEDEQQYIKAATQCDHKNVLRTIERDVVRTFPDMEFFRQNEMQGILERVLFNFASENVHISYKQGMHELLATLLYVLHTDSQNCLINYQGGYANDTIATLLDLQYLEHDAYQLFCALMKSIETWYQNDEILTTTTPGDSIGKHRLDNGLTANRTNSRQQQVSSVLGIKLSLISENIVKNHDIELFNHLEALQIAPQIYGIRWMRLLFGREFEFLDLLTVWDAIICDQVTMSLTNYIFASMLITIREELVNGDYTDCLNNLMRYQFKDVQYVIKLALHLRNPKIYPRPKEQHKQSSLSGKNFRNLQYQHLQRTQHNTKRSSTPDTSLTSRLSQQYISVKQQFQQANKSYESWTSSSSSHGRNTKVQQQPKSKQQQQQYHHRSMSQMMPIESPIKEYELREMQSSSSSLALNSLQKGLNKMPLATIYGKDSKNNLAKNSTESYEDLHSIVDYCWRLLSEQIDSLQRCLPKEKSLHSEDEIFVALAQLKKVRDVLKGSLRLEDELESSSQLEGKTSEKNK